jgi:plastocyanin
MSGPPPHYMPANVTATAAGLTFFVSNTSPAGHTIAIGRGPITFNASESVTNPPLALSALVEQGTSATFTVNGLAPGTYVFWCTIGDHAALGMVGTLTVNP